MGELSGESQTLLHGLEKCNQLNLSFPGYKMGLSTGSLPTSRHLTNAKTHEDIEGGLDVGKLYIKTGGH